MKIYLIFRPIRLAPAELQNVYGSIECQQPQLSARIRCHIPTHRPRFGQSCYVEFSPGCLDLHWGIRG